MTTIPTETLAVVAHGKGDLRVETIAVPSPEGSEAIVEIAYGGICGSDLHYWLEGAAGESILKEPMILGHEVVGTVLQQAADGTGPVAGTRVAVHPATANGTWPEGRANLATRGTYLGSAAHHPHTEGAFARHVALPARMLRTLPESLSLRDAAIVEPAAVAWHAVSRAGDLTGKRVLVTGSGPIGLLITAVAKRAGAAEIISTDVHDAPLENAVKLGAARTIQATDAEAIASVAADVVFESSGNRFGLASAFQGAARGGRVVMVGLLPSGEQPALIALAISRELELVGSFRFNDEIDEVIAALADGSLYVDPIVTHEFPASEALQAFEVARDSSVSGKVLLSF
ncbi:L-idonate 5-dehydrogenase [Diaminobutyricimonas sp. LJ205]|uniref:L-idonate 5-dehydrogenase n=1 Tax=Diaminobutyricimonas sp. LJ205 TaxID=2683590 RepID=UPI0012F50C64|nr:L-idonate 5-dehydrogenase [Diaminobutyricimonas sp. LJ205]